MITDSTDNLETQRIRLNPCNPFELVQFVLTGFRALREAANDG
jgi:hypothetical protein